MLRDMVRRFAVETLKPKAREVDQQKKISKEVLKQAAELGLFGVPFQEAYGGSALGRLGYCLMIEELARGCPSTCITIGASVSLCGTPISFAGTEEQKQKYLVPMIQGKALGAYALTEAGSGSDAAGMKATAKEDGDHYVLNGEKVFVTNGGIADIIVSFAVTDKAKGARGGITAFIIEKGMKGFKVEREEEKMGIHGSSTAVLLFQDMRVPKANVLGTVGEGFKVAMRTMDGGRLGIAADSLGQAREALDLSIKYAKERHQFGKPIGDHQAIQWMLAEMAGGIYAMESMVYRTAWMFDHHQTVPTRECAVVKMMCSEIADDIIDKGVQIHGGMGYMAEYPLERFYRDSRINRIFEGTNEIQRLVIAKDLLKKGNY